MLKKIILLIIALSLYGCSSGLYPYNHIPVSEERYYVPRPLPVKAASLTRPEMEFVRRASVKNIQKTKRIFIGGYTHRWSADLRAWTDSAVDITWSELNKRAVTRDENAERSLMLAVADVDIFWRFWQVKCDVLLEVKTGLGDVRKYFVENRNKDLYGSCDGALSLAVTNMFNDKYIQDYLEAPDTDVDGVPDFRDECPGTPFGVKVNEKGCPRDSDGDGVPDYLDKCPDTPHNVEVDEHGCPLDCDEDGVPDYKDECPGTPKGIKVDERGCPPDTDKDGVPDYRDQCPDTPLGVEVDERGCPFDKDGDGVPDYRDDCPDTPYGVMVDDRGCPLDSDGDGVFDYLDRCPDTPEGVEVDEYGCPLDSDGDGVPDYLDKCPGTLPGVVVDESGCPPDSDGDGVLNNIDRCPGTPAGAKVDELGCWVISDVLFDFDKAEIRADAYSFLENAFSVMQGTPELNVIIQGHTCNIGTEKRNDELSHMRAEAVKTYLVKKGISPIRLSAEGFGLRKPKASNLTEDGRKLNRRVEFKPIR